MQLLKGNKLGIRIALTFVLVFSVLFLLTRKINATNKAYEDANYWVRHTKDVLFVSEEINSAIRIVEAEVRGFIITGNKEFLFSFDSRCSTVFNHLQTITTLTSDNSLQQKNIHALTGLINQKIDNLKKNVKLTTSGPDAYENPKMTLQGFAISHSIDSLISAIQAEENRLLKLRVGRSKTAVDEFGIFYRSLNLLIVLAFIIYFFILRYVIQKKKKATRQLKDNQALLEAVIDNTSSLIYIKDLQGKFTKVNKTFAEELGVSPKEIIGKTVFDICPNELANIYHINDTRVLAERKLIEVEECGMVDGKVYNFLSVKFPLYNNDSDVHGVIGISTNINDVISRRALERQKEIAEKTIEVQESERAHIGRELYDNVSQLLATAKLMISSAMSAPDMSDYCLQKGQEVIVHAISEVRNLSHELMPPTFENDFVSSINELILNINLSKEVNIQFYSSSEEQLDQLDGNIKLTLYRIIQEQINNILKYSKAQNASIELLKGNSSIELRIKDDGIGFEPDKRSNGIGFRNIASRVEFHGGNFTIKSSPGNGCAIGIVIPVNK